MSFYNRLEELFDIQNELSNFFEHVFANTDRTFGLYEGKLKLDADLWENDQEYVIKIDVPGIEKNQIDISAINNTLAIKVSRPDIDQEEKKSFFRRERFSGCGERHLTLPSKINRDSISAVCKNGVLEIHCPKTEEEKPRQITIKTE